MQRSRSRKGRSDESLDKSEKEKGRRRGKSLSLTREPRRSSRESSVSSGREVRCACQYYMSDKLLPERISLFGSAPLATATMAKVTG